MPTAGRRMRTAATSGTATTRRMSATARGRMRSTATGRMTGSRTTTGMPGRSSARMRTGGAARMTCCSTARPSRRGVGRSSTRTTRSGMSRSSTRMSRSTWTGAACTRFRPSRRAMSFRPPSTGTTSRCSRKAFARSRRVESTGNAMPGMLEHAAIVSTVMPVIEDCPAMRIVCTVVVQYDPPMPARRPRAPAPAVMRKQPDRNSDREPDPKPQHQAARRRQYVETRISDEQRSPDRPRIVIRKVNQAGIYRRNQDLTVL